MRIQNLILIPLLLVSLFDAGAFTSADLKNQTDLQILINTFDSFSMNKKMRTEIFEKDYALLYQVINDLKTAYQDTTVAEGGTQVKDLFYFMSYLYLGVEPRLAEDRQIEDLAAPIDATYQSVLSIIARYGWPVEVSKEDGSKPITFENDEVLKIKPFDGTKKTVKYTGAGLTVVFVNALPPILNSLQSSGLMPPEFNAKLVEISALAKQVHDNPGVSDLNKNVDKPARRMIDIYDQTRADQKTIERQLRQSFHQEAINQLTRFDLIFVALKELKNYGDGYSRKAPQP